MRLSLLPVLALLQMRALMGVALLLTLTLSTGAVDTPTGPSHGGSPTLSEVLPHLVIDAQGHTAIIRRLLFTADGREIISASDDKTVRVWTVSPDGRRAALARTLRGQLDDGEGGTLVAAALAPPDAQGQHRWLAVGGMLAGERDAERYAVRLHDYASGEVVALLPGHRDKVFTLAFAPTGRWLASAGKDNTIRLWDLTALQGNHMTREPLILSGHTDHIYDLAWSPTASRLASASYDTTVGLWNTEQLAQGTIPLIARLRAHHKPVPTVAFHPDGTVLASGSKDQTIRLWRAQDGAARGIFAHAAQEVAALTFSPDGRQVLAGRIGGPDTPKRITLYAYPEGTEQRIFTAQQNIVLATAFHPQGQWMASGGGDQKDILLWDVKTGETLSRLQGKGATIWAVGFSPDRRFLSWGQTFHYTSDIQRGPLEYHFDLTTLTRLSAPAPATPVVQARDRVGALKLVTERGGRLGYAFRLHIQRQGKTLGTIERGETDGYQHTAYTFTADGHYVLSGGFHGVLRLYSLDGTLRAKWLQKPRLAPESREEIRGFLVALEDCITTYRSTIGIPALMLPWKEQDESGQLSTGRVM